MTNTNALPMIGRPLSNDENELSGEILRARAI